MLSSICTIRRCIFAGVKFLSRLFTALNLLPSMATIASVNRSSLRHSTMNWRHTLRIAGPLSLRKLAMVLKSGITSRHPHELDVALCLALQPAAGLDAIQVAVDVELQQHRRVIRRPPRRRRVNPNEAKHIQIKPIDEDLDHAN